MTDHDDDPEPWRVLAAEARAKAATRENPMVRKVMLRVAETYEALAERATVRPE